MEGLSPGVQSCSISISDSAAHSMFPGVMLHAFTTSLIMLRSTCSGCFCRPLICCIIWLDLFSGIFVLVFGFCKFLSRSCVFIMS